MQRWKLLAAPQTGDCASVADKAELLPSSTCSDVHLPLRCNASYVTQADGSLLECELRGNSCETSEQRRWCMNQTQTCSARAINTMISRASALHNKARRTQVRWLDAAFVYSGLINKFTYLVIESHKMQLFAQVSTYDVFVAAHPHQCARWHQLLLHAALTPANLSCVAVSGGISLRSGPRHFQMCSGALQ